MEERLQKIIARAGVASRRRAEQLIVSGHVTVNGKVVTELGTRADAARDHIKVSGKLLQGAEEHVYIALHKPAEVVATLSDPEGRRSLGDLLSAVPVRVYPVGRLEYHASGLLFLTNDGELANKLIRTHGLRQTYLLKVKGNLSDSEIAKAAAVSRARIERGQRGENPWYEVTMADASRDPLREQLALMGHPVEKMKRIKMASLEIGDLAPGRFRSLTLKEVTGLEAAVKKAASHPQSAASPPSPRPARPPRRNASRGRNRG
jgi:23S rRNA pseudouridine2605 synthase